MSTRVLLGAQPRGRRRRLATTLTLVLLIVPLLLALSGASRAAAGLAGAPGTQVVPADGERLIPETILFPEHQQEPIFFAESMLVEDSQGRVDLVGAEAATAASARRLFEKLSGSEGCGRYDSRLNSQNRLPRDQLSLESVVAANDIAIVGEVVETRAGLSWFIPGTMIAIKPSEILSGEWAREKLMLVFLPVGRVESATNCIDAVNADWAALPTVGQSVLLLFKDNWLNRTSPLKHVEGTGLILLGQGAAGVPAPLRPSLGILSGPEIAKTVAAEFLDRSSSRERRP